MDPSWNGAAVTEAVFSTEDGVEIRGAEVGSGSDGIVLISGTSAQGLCNWSKVAPALAQDGFHVLALDHRCVGESECPEPDASGLDLDVTAAVAELRRLGAERITLIGESRGGAIALATATRTDLEVDAVVALSAVEIDEIYSGPDPAPLAELVERIEVPVLYISSRDDASVDQTEHLAWSEATPDSTYVVHDDLGHGAVMLADPSESAEGTYAEDLLPFLKGNR